MAKKSNNETIIDIWTDLDNLILLEGWARDGYTLPDIAARMGISYKQFLSIMNESDDIKKAVNQGRELVNYKVENALLKSALGYTTKETTVRTTIRGGRIIETQKETVEKQVAPNVSAVRLWLLNRNPEKYKPESQRGILDELEEDTTIKITVERAGDGDNATEVDENWKDEVNESVTLRKATEAEQAEARAQISKKRKADAEKRKTLVEKEDGIDAKTKRKTRQSR
ncbi:MAG: hypothetical protein MJ168_07980 [Clostridia bacterium]|nr:hypothetical protein [Clostridia bacterium]